MANNVIEMDSKYLQQFDKQYAANSQVWDILRAGGSQITDADFVGAKTVLVNKLSGLSSQSYKRNADNDVTPIKVEKEPITLTHEDWAAYQIDNLDTTDNLVATVQNVIEEHRRIVAPVNFDKAAVDAILAKNGKTVTDTITKKNVLEAYDEAEAYMLDHEVSGDFVMFVSSVYYQILKNAAGVSRTFTTNTQNIRGIDRRVSQIDGSVPILPVGLKHGADKFAFILTPLSAVSPIIKYSNLTYIPSQYDTKGNRDTVKFTNYYDAVILDNAKEAIYVATTADKSDSGSAASAPTGK